MRTRRNKSLRRKRNTKRHRGGKAGKKWTTAIDAAQKTLSKTGSLDKARTTLKKQALTNARKLFGSIASI
jgi:hypothetical protein